MPSLLRKLFERRTARAAWLYWTILFLYGLYAVAFVAHLEPPDSVTALALALPVVLIVAQAAHPTLAGWGLIVTGVGAAAAIYLYYITQRTIQAVRGSLSDVEGLTFSVVVFALLIVVGVTLAGRRPTARATPPEQRTAGSAPRPPGGPS